MTGTSNAMSQDIPTTFYIVLEIYTVDRLNSLNNQLEQYTAIDGSPWEGDVMNLHGNRCYAPFLVVKSNWWAL